MVMKDYSAFPKLQHYWNLTIWLFSVISTHWGSPTPLQRFSRCILPRTMRPWNSNAVQEGFFGRHVFHCWEILTCVSDSFFFLPHSLDTFSFLWQNCKGIKGGRKKTRIPLNFVVYSYPVVEKMFSSTSRNSRAPLDKALDEKSRNHSWQIASLRVRHVCLCSVGGFCRGSYKQETQHLVKFEVLAGIYVLNL